MFRSSFEGQPESYVIPATGGKPRNFTSNPAVDGFPSFSHYGKWVYFASNQSGEYRIWKVPASGGDAVRVTDTAGYTPLESRDGAYFYDAETMDSRARCGACRYPVAIRSRCSTECYWATTR